MTPNKVRKSEHYNYLSHQMIIISNTNLAFVLKQGSKKHAILTVGGIKIQI